MQFGEVQIARTIPGQQTACSGLPRILIGLGQARLFAYTFMTGYFPLFHLLAITDSDVAIRFLARN